MSRETLLGQRRVKQYIALNKIGYSRKIIGERMVFFRNLRHGYDISNSKRIFQESINISFLILDLKSYDIYISIKVLLSPNFVRYI